MRLTVWEGQGIEDDVKREDLVTRGSQRDRTCEDSPESRKPGGVANQAESIR